MVHLDLIIPQTRPNLLSASTRKAFFLPHKSTNPSGFIEEIVVLLQNKKPLLNPPRYESRNGTKKVFDQKTDFRGGEGRLG